MICIPTTTFLVCLVLLDVHALTLEGAGSRFAGMLYNAAIVTYLATSPETNKIAINYLSCGSSEGICLLENNCSDSVLKSSSGLDFATSDLILGPTDYQNYNDIQMFPIAVGAVVPIYNLASLPANYSLILSKVVLARIFMLNITQWSDPEITSLNPMVSNELKSMSNPLIQVVARADSSGLSDMWSSYLSAAWPPFANSVGRSSRPTWLPGTLLVFQQDHMTAVVSKQAGSIGYQDVYCATLYAMPMVSILKSKVVVSANLASMEYAAFELGTSFGNNGDVPDHLTADLSNPKTILAWPICGYTYLVVRKQFVRPGTTCQSRHETVKFWSWFLSSPISQEVTRNFMFVPLGERARKFVLDKLQSVVQCNDQAVFLQASPPSIRFGVNSFFLDHLDYLFESAFQEVSPGTSSFVYSRLNNETDLPQGVDILMVKGSPFQHSLFVADITSFPFVGVAYCFVYNVCGPDNPSCQKGGSPMQRLALSMEMILNILIGKILYWNDTMIVTLNPEFAMMTHPIKMYYSASTTSDLMVLNYAFPAMMSSFHFDSSLLNAKAKPTERMALLRVMDTPYSFSFVHFDTTVNDASNAELWENPVLVSTVVRLDGIAVGPSIASIGACASNTFDTKHEQFNFQQSTAPACYPLSVEYQLCAKTHHTESSCDQMSTAFQVAIFLEWILTRGPLSQGFLLSLMYPSFSEVDAAYKTIKQKLITLTCNGKSILGVETNYNYISSWAVPVAWSFSALNTSAGLVLGIWIFKHRMHQAIRLAQPEFLSLIIIGSVLMSFSLVPLAMDDIWVEYYDLDGNLNLDVPNPRLDFACRSVPWLYLSGFAFEFSALFTKVLRLKKLLLQKSLKRTRITVLNMLPVVVGCLLSCWLICAIWTGIAPLHWKRFATQLNSAGVMIDSYGHCVSVRFLEFYVVGALVQAGALSYGMFLCYQTRNMKEDFVENKWITIVLLNMMSTIVLTFLLGFFMRQNSSALFVIEMLNLVMMSFGVMVVMILPKIQAVHSSEKSKSKLFPSLTPIVCTAQMASQSNGTPTAFERAKALCQQDRSAAVSISQGCVAIENSAQVNVIPLESTR